MTATHRFESGKLEATNRSRLGEDADMMAVLPQFELRLSLDGDTLLASLTDEHALALVGEVSGAGVLLHTLAECWYVAPGQHQAGLTDAALYEQLLPQRIRHHLTGVAKASLTLLLAPEFLLIPWERLYDGKRTWQSDFQITRTLIGKKPASATPGLAVASVQPLRLLICVLPGSAHQLDILKWGGSRIEQSTGLKVTVLSSPDLKTDDSQSPGLGYDLVHVLGEQADMLATLEHDGFLRPLVQKSRLLFLDFAGRGHPPMGWGPAGQRLSKLGAIELPMLIRQRTPGCDINLEAAEQIYRQLVAGVPLGKLQYQQPGFLQSPSFVFSVFGDANYNLAVREKQDGFRRSFRQVTSLSYDIVGSTELMQQLGIEAYSLALNEYHQKFAAVVHRWGGVSDAPQGDDGIMCYFGVHQSNETTVRSAIFSALDLVDEAVRLGAKVRVGLATGQVAIDEAHFVGLTVHLAARIQSLAEPGEILVSGSTADLVRGTFSLSPFQYEKALKGFSPTTPVFKVTQAKQLQHWAQWSTGRDKPMVGRDAELNLLMEHWDNVCKNSSLWLHLSGEAGIGKSHLVSELSKQLERHHLAQVFMCRCFPETNNRAFGPVIELLERWFNITATDTQTVRQTKLANAFLQSKIDTSETQAVAQMLGIALPKSANVIGRTPEPSRRRILKTMVQWMASAARRHPLLFVVEDIHWADPSTLEFLALLKTQSGIVPLFAILTERLDKQPSARHVLVDADLYLNRLNGDAVHALIRSLAQNAPLSRQVVSAIEAKADGIPLFVEMSTRMALEASERDDVGSDALGKNFQIPMTVRDLLMQRLDSLGSARALAQLCGAIGREFSLDLLTAIVNSGMAPVEPGRLNRLLVMLIEGGLLMVARNQAEQHFYFRHALIQDVAYQSMWETDRRLLHKGIAHTLETSFPDICKNQPEILAHHHAARGAAQDAVKWHMLAGKKFKQKMAHLEALAHFDAAKHQLNQLPASQARDRTELEIELTSAGQMVATKGYGVASVGQRYMRALALSHSLNDKKSLLRAQLGIEVYHFARGDFGLAHAYIAQAQATAQEFNDGMTTAQCLWVVANILFHQGEVKTSLDKMEACIAHCRSTVLSTNLTQSPEVMSLLFSSFANWQLGHTTLALERSEESVVVAEASGQRLGIGQALGMRAMVLLMIGKSQEAQTVSERAITVCEAGEHDMWVAHARFILGSALAETGEPQTGLALMDEADTLWASTGSILTRSFYLSMRAKVNAQLQNHAKAQVLIEEAWGIVNTYGERYFEPEVLRLKAELLLLAPGGANDTSIDKARSWFADSVASAQARQLKALELRTVCSQLDLEIRLGHVDATQTRPYDALAALLHFFENETETKDLVYAHQLLVRAASRTRK